MDRKLKKRAFDLFARSMQESLPSFKPFKEKSLYVWPGELIWQDTDTIPNATLYVILSPEPKGRDQFTVELGWSKIKRFPQLGTRPSLFNRSYLEGCYQKEEAVIRLPSLLDDEEWINIDTDNVEAAILNQVRSLLSYGMPFLRGLQQA